MMICIRRLCPWMLKIMNMVVMSVSTSFSNFMLVLCNVCESLNSDIKHVNFSLFDIVCFIDSCLNELVMFWCLGLKKLVKRVAAAEN